MIELTPAPAVVTPTCVAVGGRHRPTLSAGRYPVNIRSAAGWLTAADRCHPGVDCSFQQVVTTVFSLWVLLRKLRVVTEPDNIEVEGC